MPDKENVVEQPDCEKASMTVGVGYSDYDREHENYYRQLRIAEMKDDLSIRVMNLSSDRFTDKVKELAAKYLESRF